MNDRIVRSAPWALISNMYPSPADPSYGAFVGRNHEDLRAEGFNIQEEVVIRGRSTGLRRVRAYASHYAGLLMLLLKPNRRHYYVHYVSHHCLIPALGASWFGKRTVVNIHGDDLLLGRSTLYRRIMSVGQARLVRSARLLVVPSQFFKELTLERFPDIPSARIVVSPSSGIDFPKLSAATTRRPCYWAADPAHRIAEFGYIGRIEADKGWESLFDAFLALPESQRSRAKLHFWGIGHQVGQLRDRIEKEGQGRVLYHSAIPPSELPRAHAQFDFHVVPSQRESLGLAALEGMAAGHVMICSTIRPFTDFTRNGESAFHFDPAQPGALTKALSHVLERPDHALASVAAQGQQIARGFDRASVSQTLARHIDDALQS